MSQHPSQRGRDTDFPPCRPDDGDIVNPSFQSALRALTLTSNVSRAGDYVLATTTEKPLDGTRGFNLFLLQPRLQFMFELADQLYSFIGADEAVTVGYSDFHYVREDVDMMMPVAYSVTAAWTPEPGDFDHIAYGLIVELGAELTETCDILCQGKVQAVFNGPLTKFTTADPNKGAVLAAGYLKARVLKRDINVPLEFNGDGTLKRIQLQ